MQLKRFKKAKKRLLWVMILAIIYSTFVLSYVWWQCFTSALQGGKNGQLDAYRHTLASAVVAYTTSPKIVNLVTVLMEGKAENANLMDKHNNAIGAQIGNNAATFNALKPMVISHISQGAINTNKATQSTWLPQKYWAENLFW